MQEEENIQFENISGFGDIKIDLKKTDFDDEKEYDSLYDELYEKCNPNHFLKPFIKDKFDISNDIYGKLKKTDRSDLNTVIKLRNRAMSELGIHFSTRKMYRVLLKYFNPSVYISLQPYDANRVRTASDYYSKLLKSKNSILDLEALYKEAYGFIKKYLKDFYEEQEDWERVWNVCLEQQKMIREEQLKEEAKKDKIIATIFCVCFLLAIVGLVFTTK